MSIIRNQSALFSVTTNDSRPSCFLIPGVQDSTQSNAVRRMTELAAETVASMLYDHEASRPFDLLVNDRWEWNRDSIISIAAAENPVVAALVQAGFDSNDQDAIRQVKEAALRLLMRWVPRVEEGDFSRCNQRCIAVSRLRTIASHRLPAAAVHALTCPPSTASGLRLSILGDEFLLDCTVRLGQFADLPVRRVVDGDAVVNQLVPCSGAGLIISSTDRRTRWVVTHHGFWLAIHDQILIAHGHIRNHQQTPGFILALLDNWREIIMRAFRAHADLNGGMSWAGEWCSTPLSRRCGITRARYNEWLQSSLTFAEWARTMPVVPRTQSETDQRVRESQGTVMPAPRTRLTAWNWQRIPAAVRTIMEHDLTLHLEDPQ